MVHRNDIAFVDLIEVELAESWQQVVAQQRLVRLSAPVEY